MITINPYYSAKISIGFDLIRAAQDIENFFADLTNTASKITRPINLDISDVLKIHNRKIPIRSLLDDLDDIFEDIGDIGDYPPGYSSVRNYYEETFGSKECRDKKNWDYRSDADFKGALRRIFDPMNNGDLNWTDWADESGYPDLAHKIKEAYGKLMAVSTYVSAEYSRNNRTITLYKSVLGNPEKTINNWISAFAFCIFLAYEYDAYEDTAAIDDILLYSLADYAVYRFLEDELHDSTLSRDHYSMWRACDMTYWPYSGALYFCDVEILRRRENILFVRTFKRSLKNAKDAFEDLKAAHRTYEGYDFKKRTPKGTSTRINEKYFFNGIEYNKSNLAAAIVRQYIADNPGVTSTELIAAFNDTYAIVLTKADLIARIEAGLVKEYQYFLNPKHLVSAADCDCSVLKYWQKATINVLLKKAASLGYKVTAI